MILPLIGLTLPFFLLTPAQAGSLNFTAVTAAESGIDYTPSLRSPGSAEYFAMTGGAAAADYNNDGWVDLYITRTTDGDLLYRNNGNGTFTDVTSSSGINRVAGSNGAAFGDIDNDGWLDL